MSLVSKINRSRETLKGYLKDEWDVSTITSYSDRDIETMYNTKVPQTKTLISFGNATPCNFSLQNLKVPSHTLHVVYYNFGELTGPPTRITKTCGEKLNNLYVEQIISPDDSLIVVFQVPITDNIQKSIENVYLNGQEDLKLNQLSDDITGENESLGDNKYSLRHFRNIHAFSLDHLLFDIRRHEKVPKHENHRQESDIGTILSDCNATLSQLPVIQRTDIQARVMRMAPGDVCKITRDSSVGQVVAYRVCH
jgi:DNA-directed RNA polymerase subunit H (RpoH/RPB5)